MVVNAAQARSVLFEAGALDVLAPGATVILMATCPPGEAEAIAKVFNAINSGHATDQVMAYQYLQSLPLLAQGSANKVFVIPAELSGALSAVSRAFAGYTPTPADGADVVPGESVAQSEPLAPGGTGPGASTT